VLGHAAVLQADPILISATRNVAVFTAFEQNGERIDSLVIRSSNDFGPLELQAASTSASGASSATATGFQRSVIDTSRISATAEIEGIADFADVLVAAQAGSFFLLEFDLTGPHRFSFDGSVRSEGEVFTEFETGLIEELSLTEFPLGSSGILRPGHYRLFMSAFTEVHPAEGSFARGLAAFDMDLSLQAVPEPATLLLLATGLGAGAWRRRTRRTG
jgi:hypothetical protein